MQFRRVLVGFLLLATSWAAGADCRNTTPEAIEANKTNALAAPTAQTSEEEGYLKVRMPQPNGDEVITYFTLPSHPAHPSSVVSAIYASEGKIWLYSRGATAGDCSAFEQWLGGFAAQHKKVQQEMQAKSGK